MKVMERTESGKRESVQNKTQIYVSGISVRRKSKVMHLQIKIKRVNAK
jgi:hypothetical protein